MLDCRHNQRAGITIHFYVAFIVLLRSYHLLVFASRQLLLELVKVSLARGEKENVQYLHALGHAQPKPRCGHKVESARRYLGRVRLAGQWSR